MKFILTVILFSSFSVKASPIFTVKERLRLHLWTFGLEEKPQDRRLPSKNAPKLPEELERAIRKI